MLGDQQFSTVSQLAAAVDAELDSRLTALKSIASVVDPATMASPAAVQAVLKARPLYGWNKMARQREITDTTLAPPDMVYTVRYGLESYFVPEGTGRALEKLAREKKLAAVIAVDAKGNSAIKGLMVDGKLQYEEPLL